MPPPQKKKCTNVVSVEQNLLHWLKEYLSEELVFIPTVQYNTIQYNKYHRCVESVERFVEAVLAVCGWLNTFLYFTLCCSDEQAHYCTYNRRQIVTEPEITAMLQSLAFLSAISF